MASAQSTTGDISLKQLPRARDQISQRVDQFRLDRRYGASWLVLPLSITWHVRLMWCRFHGQVSLLI